MSEITLGTVTGDYSSPDYISKILDRSEFLSSLVDERWELNPNLEIEEDETEDQVLEKLYSIVKWNQSPNIEKQKVFKVILDRLNDESSDWKFVGVLNQNSSFSAKIDCSRCNIVEKTKRYGCKFCKGHKLEITINSDETMIIVTCQDKECNQTYEGFIPLNGAHLSDTGNPYLAQQLHSDVCMECQGKKSHLKDFKINNSIGVFEHIPTKMVFNLIPGNKGLDHKQIYHDHGESIHFCSYPEKSCCCYIGSERNPFLISKTPATWKQAGEASPNIMGFGNIYNFNIKNIYFASQNNIPATNMEKKQAEDWLEHHGLRLPSVDEWNYAARGSAATAYPWGNELDHNRENILSSDNPNGYISIPADSIPVSPSFPNFMTDGVTESQLRGFGIKNSSDKEPSQIAKRKKEPIYIQTHGIPSGNAINFGSGIGYLSANSLNNLNKLSGEHISSETVEETVTPVQENVLSIQSVARPQIFCNGFGLSDMIGNVKEYTSSYIVGGSVFDPISRYPHPSDQYIFNPRNYSAMADIGFRAAVSIPGIVEVKKEDQSLNVKNEVVLPLVSTDIPLEIQKRAAEFALKSNILSNEPSNKAIDQSLLTNNSFIKPGFIAALQGGSNNQTDPKIWAEKAIEFLTQQGKEWLISSNFNSYIWLDMVTLDRYWFGLAIVALRELVASDLSSEYAKIILTTSGSESLDEWFCKSIDFFRDPDVWSEKAIKYLTQEGRDSLLNINLYDFEDLQIISWLTNAGIDSDNFSSIFIDSKGERSRTNLSKMWIYKALGSLQRLIKKETLEDRTPPEGPDLSGVPDFMR